MSFCLKFHFLFIFITIFVVYIPLLTQPFLLYRCKHTESCQPVATLSFCTRREKFPISSWRKNCGYSIANTTCLTFQIFNRYSSYNDEKIIFVSCYSTIELRKNSVSIRPSPKKIYVFAFRYSTTYDGAWDLQKKMNQHSILSEFFFCR